MTVQPELTQPPPMPTQVEENSSSPALCAVAVGTVQVAEISWKVVPPFSSIPWL